MCELIRTIWPVGHGAFYTEVLHTPRGPISVVYDCGGKDTQIITDNVNHLLSRLPKANGRPVVDMVFISHFHKDHINGLQYLLKNADVKNLIIPQIDQNALLEAYLYNAITNANGDNGDVDSDEQNIIFQLVQEGEIEGNTNIVQVELYNNAERPRNDNQESREESQNKGRQDNEITYDVDNKNPLTNQLSSGQIISVKYLEEWWEYIPVNVFENAQSKLQSLINELAKIVYNSTSLVNQGHVDFSLLKSYLKNNSIKQIKEVYEKVFGKNDNIYSLLLYSGSMKYERQECNLLRFFGDCLCDFGECCGRHHCCNCCFEGYIRHAVSCLYTGDFEPESKLNGQTFVNIVREILRERWFYIGMVQIPHHASSNNYSNALYNFPKFAFANVNSHGDISFSQSVIRDIPWMGCRTMIVTEKDNQQDFIIHFVP